jgi:uncharacterized protein with HEPN domain
MGSELRELQDDDLIATILAAAGRAAQHTTRVPVERFLAEPLLQDALAACLMIVGQSARAVTPMLRNWAVLVPWDGLDALADWQRYARPDEDRLRWMWGFAREGLPEAMAALRATSEPPESIR